MNIKSCLTNKVSNITPMDKWSPFFKKNRVKTYYLIWHYCFFLWDNKNLPPHKQRTTSEDPKSLLSSILFCLSINYHSCKCIVLAEQLIKTSSSRADGWNMLFRRPQLEETIQPCSCKRRMSKQTKKKLPKNLLKLFWD